MNEVIINGKKYPVKFGLSRIKSFALSKNLKTIEQFDKWVAKLSDGSFESIQNMGELLLTGIQRGCQKSDIDCDVDVDDVIDMAFENADEFGKLTTILKLSMDTGESLNVSKQTKKKK
ncbi:MAG: hypothetical protein HON94_11315 [Methylococcales bacterium]|jgi:hypothetical protein|nr:hypothetical protein [Methylococcales bacterium]